MLKKKNTIYANLTVLAKNKWGKKKKVQIQIHKTVLKEQKKPKKNKPAVAKHNDAMPCQQRTKKKEVYFNRQLTSGSAFSLSYPFILKQLCKHELSVSFKKRHGKWARIGQMDTTAKHLLQNKHAHPRTLKAIQLNVMQPMQTQKLHFPIRQLGLNFEWHGTHI